MWAILTQNGAKVFVISSENSLKLFKLKNLYQQFSEFRKKTHDFFSLFYILNCAHSDLYIAPWFWIFWTARRALFQWSKNSNCLDLQTERVLLLTYLGTMLQLFSYYSGVCSNHQSYKWYKSDIKYFAILLHYKLQHHHCLVLENEWDSLICIMYVPCYCSLTIGT